MSTLSFKFSRSGFCSLYDPQRPILQVSGAATLLQAVTLCLEDFGTSLPFLICFINVVEPKEFLGRNLGRLQSATNSQGVVGRVSVSALVKALESNIQSAKDISIQELMSPVGLSGCGSVIPNVVRLSNFVSFWVDGL